MADGSTAGKRLGLRHGGAVDPAGTAGLCPAGITEWAHGGRTTEQINENPALSGTAQVQELPKKGCTSLWEGEGVV